MERWTIRARRASSSSTSSRKAPAPSLTVSTRPVLLDWTAKSSRVAINDPSRWSLWWIRSSSSVISSAPSRLTTSVPIGAVWCKPLSQKFLFFLSLSLFYFYFFIYWLFSFFLSFSFRWVIIINLSAFFFSFKSQESSLNTSAMIYSLHFVVVVIIIVAVAVAVIVMKCFLIGRKRL